MFRWLVNTVLLYILSGLKFLLMETLLQCSLPSFFLLSFLKQTYTHFCFFAGQKENSNRNICPFSWLL